MYPAGAAAHRVGKVCGEPLSGRSRCVPTHQRSSALAPNQTRLRASPRQPAVFLWEGVIMYLDRPAIESTLRKIASG
jgi:O-methyltransferase involved in polyketide biosynthesis